MAGSLRGLRQRIQREWARFPYLRDCAHYRPWTTDAYGVFRDARGNITGAVVTDLWGNALPLDTAAARVYATMCRVVSNRKPAKNRTATPGVNAAAVGPAPAGNMPELGTDYWVDESMPASPGHERREATRSNVRTDHLPSRCETREWRA
jgi:hypothetical protein